MRIRLQYRIRGLSILVLGALILVVPAAAHADTIYLKNGRVIRTEQTRVDNDMLYFTQLGGEVAIPMALVDRIVEDEYEEPPPTPVPPAATESETPPEGEEGEAAEGGEGDAETTPPEETREYWQDRVRSIVTERTDLEEQLLELRREERAFLFSHRSTAETRQQIEAVQARMAELDRELVDLRQEARRLRVPAGWLRLDSRGTTTG